MRLVRDEFSAKTIRILQGRVGHRCSNPECPRVTIGPALEEDRTSNVGTAAHITVADVGGPRYDKTLTSEERRSPSNGIWLCAICGRLIDTDKNRFTADLLRKWKAESEGLEPVTFPALGFDKHDPRGRENASSWRPGKRSS
jgi:hypothetical protein